jgi:hypothetical protein
VLVSLAVLVGAAFAAAGSFEAKTDVATYVDSANPTSDFSGKSDTLWAASVDGKPAKEVYLGFINNFGTVGLFNPDSVKSATLKLDAKNVEKAGTIKGYLVHGATTETMTWNDKLEYNSEFSSVLDVQSSGECTVDVTSLIKQAVKECTEGCPYSIVLIADGSTSVGFSNKVQLEYATSA